MTLMNTNPKENDKTRSSMNGLFLTGLYTKKKKKKEQQIQWLYNQLTYRYPEHTNRYTIYLELTNKCVWKRVIRCQV